MATSFDKNLIKKYPSTAGMSSAYDSTGKLKTVATTPATAIKTPAVAPTATKPTITPTAPAATSDADTLAKINAIKSQLAGLTARQSALTAAGVSDEKDLPKVVKTSTPTITSPAVTDQAKIDALVSRLGTTDSTTQARQAQIDALLGKLTSSPTAAEQYRTYAEEAGITSKQKAVDTTTKLINDLEENLNARIGGTLTTEAQRARELAVEQKPLVKQLETQYSGLQGAQEQVNTMMGYATDQTSQDYATLQALQDMVSTQTPQQQLAQQITSEQIMKELQLGNYLPSATESKPISVSAGSTLVDPQTGEVIYEAPSALKSVQGGLFDTSTGTWIVSPKESEGTAPTSYKEWELAGGQAGTGKTYSEWVSQTNVKPATVAQQTVAEYAARLEQAEPTLTTLQDTIKNYNPAQFQAELWSPISTFKSDTIQQYEQAARNFINAKLRRESGAVISKTEFSDARKQYLPQPGDTDAALKLKEQNRKLVFESLKKASGTAYISVSELLGETTPTSSLPEGGWTKADVDTTVTNHMSEYGTPEELIQALVDQGVDPTMATGRVNYLWNK